MNQINKDAFKGCDKILAMLPYQLQWAEEHSLNKAKYKREKARNEKKRYFEKVRREKALFELL